jgi:hypothetical protein
MIHSKIKIICLLFAISLLAFAPPKLVKRKLSEEVTIKMPADFRPMTDDEIAARYFTYKKPTAMFTDENVKVDFGLNINDTEWKYKDLEMMKNFYKASMLRMFSKVTMLQEKMLTINKYQFAAFEFVSEIKSEEGDIRQLKPLRTYTYMLYTIYADKAIVLNFSCPEALKEKWQPVAQEMMQTVVVK